MRLKIHLMLAGCLAVMVPFTANAQIRIELDTRQSCKNVKGIVELTDVRVAIESNKDASELSTKLERMNMNSFCDCVFDEYRDDLGNERYEQIVKDIDAHLSSSQKAEEDDKMKKIRFECFNKQTDENLMPATPEEIVAAMSGKTVQGMENDKDVSATRQKYAFLIGQFEAYKIEKRTCPKDSEEVYETRKKLFPSNIEQYKDAWGNYFIPKNDDCSVLYSMGKDGKGATADDIYPSTKQDSDRTYSPILIAPEKSGFFANMFAPKAASGYASNGIDEQGRSLTATLMLHLKEKIEQDNLTRLDPTNFQPKDINDAWGTSLKMKMVYEPLKLSLLISAGPDKIFDTEDDLLSDIKGVCLNCNAPLSKPLK